MHQLLPPNPSQKTLSQRKRSQVVRNLKLETLEKKRKDEPHGAVQRAASAKLYQGTVDIILCKDGTVAGRICSKFHIFYIAIP